MTPGLCDFVPAGVCSHGGRRVPASPSGDSMSHYGLLKGSLQWASNVKMGISPKMAQASWKNRARAPSRWQGLVEAVAVKMASPGGRINKQDAGTKSRDRATQTQSLDLWQGDPIMEGMLTLLQKGDPDPASQHTQGQSEKG